MQLLSYADTIPVLSGALADPDGWCDPYLNIVSSFPSQYFAHPSGVRLRLDASTQTADCATEYTASLYVQHAGTRLAFDPNIGLYEQKQDTETLFVSFGTSETRDSLTLAEFQQMLSLYFTPEGRLRLFDIHQVLAVYLLEAVPNHQGIAFAYPSGMFRYFSPKTHQTAFKDPRICPLLKDIPLFVFHNSPFSIEWSDAFHIEIGASAHVQARIFQARTSPLYRPTQSPS